jgi:LytS/YehU family sensor histidine kinase
VFRPKEKKETWLPVLALVLISASVIMDYTVEYSELSVGFLTIAITISCMMYYIWLHLQFVRAHERELQAEHRIRIMMTQIQPHFLFNTLTAIRALCVKDPDAAVHTIGLFSTYLRQNLQSLDKAGLIPLSKELEHTRVYTEIEMIRFPNISVQYDIRDNECSVPALTVQPLVENAVRHGVATYDKGGTVQINAHRADGKIIIEVIDDGSGRSNITQQQEKRKGIGIENVRARLHSLRNGELEIISGEQGTTARITIADVQSMGGKQ